MLSCLLYRPDIIDAHADCKAEILSTPSDLPTKFTPRVTIAVDINSSPSTDGLDLTSKPSAPLRHHHSLPV